MKNFIYLLVVVALVVLGVKYFKNTPTQEGNTNISMVSLKSVSNAATPALVNAKVVTWETSNYPTEAGVTINILKKTSDTPQKFSFVRTVALDTANDGEETITLLPAENPKELYVEVTCSNTFAFENGCQATGQVMPVSK